MNNNKTTVSRREFLHTAGSIMILTGSANSLLTSCAKTKKVIVGAHPWIYASTRLKRDIYPILDNIFSDMKYAGMDGIELMHTALLHSDSVERIKHLCDKYTLSVIGTSFGAVMWDSTKHDTIMDDAELIITRIAELGGRTLGVSVGRTREKKTEKQLDAQAELLRKMISLCEANHVVLNLHNHTYEVENELHDLKGTINRIPDVKLGPDINWLIRGGVDPVQFIKEFSDRIVFLHLRDQKADGTWPEAMGEGDTDFKPISQALREIRFAGDAVIELAHERNFQPTRPIKESLKISRDYVRKTLGY
ncbi:sugar phosphate isomerase/epimerase family protein [candidate division KSB1 bacterium]